MSLSLVSPWRRQASPKDVYDAEAKELRAPSRAIDEWAAEPERPPTLSPFDFRRQPVERAP